MDADQLQSCLDHLDRAEALLLAAQDWATAAHLSLVIDRLLASHGLPERPVNLGEFTGWRPSQGITG